VFGGPAVAEVVRDRSLTVKQERFVTALMGECKGNAAAAARAAGYSGDNHAMTVVGARLLANVGVRARIDGVLAAEAMPVGEVLAEISRVARADFKEFVQVRYDIRGEVVDARIVLSDKVRALELLMRYYGLFVDRRDETVTVLRVEGLDVRDV
jgi:phage terminase small subunit